MEMLQFEQLLAAYWWLIIVLIALILGVRGTIPIWLGLAIAAIILVSFSNNAISYSLRTVLFSGGQVIMNVFR